MTDETRMPQKISWTVKPIDRLSIADTSSFVRELFPRSPWTAPLTQSEYWTRIGLLMPRRSWHCA